MRQLLHLSDVHFGPHHCPEIAAGVLELIAGRRPDLVVISGDLTQRAKPYQFAAARRFVDRIPVPTLVVPGNHDVPLYRVWERVLAPYGVYRKHFSADLEPVFQDEEIAVIGLNTAYNWTTKNGRVTAAQLRRLGERLASLPPNLSKIVVAHHNLIAPPAFGGKHRPLANAAELVALCVGAGVRLLLCGHVHVALRAPSSDFFAAGTPSLEIVHAGTTTSDRGRMAEERRNTCNWITLSGSDVGIHHLVWEGHEFVAWNPPPPPP